MNMKSQFIHALILSTVLLLFPVGARAQIDAILDAVVDAVEPTPVYDTDLKVATMNLAQKIERLNQVLFGGAEETSAAFRYRALYSDLLDVTTSLTDAVGQSYNDYQRLKRMYDGLQSAGYYDYVVDGQTCYYMYKNNAARYKRLVDDFTKIFHRTTNTNSDVKEAARDAIGSLRTDTERERDSVNLVISSTMAAVELAKAADILSFSATDYVKQSEEDYGTDIQSSSGGGGYLGSVGTFVMVMIGLMSVIYSLFIGIRIMNGYPETEKLIARLVIVMVIALVIILSLQPHI